MFTLDDIQHSYSTINKTPCCGAYLLGDQCCPISALMIDRIGLEEFKNILVNQHDIALKNINEILNVGTEKINSFIRGFDGLKATRYDDSEAFSLGVYCWGKLINNREADSVHDETGS